MPHEIQCLVCNGKEFPTKEDFLYVQSKLFSKYSKCDKCGAIYCIYRDLYSYVISKNQDTENQDTELVNKKEGKILNIKLLENLKCDEVLEESIKKLDTVLVVGWDREGEFYTNTNMRNSEVLWAIEMAKISLFQESGVEF